MIRARTLSIVSVAIVCACALACGWWRSGDVSDNPDGKSPADFPQTTVDVFKAMDGGIELSPDEIQGRNTWLLWTGGNEYFWDRMSRESFGLVDLIKVLDSRQRATRFKEKGLINEPGFRQATAPDEFGLWLDQRVDPEPEGIDRSIYGSSSGVIGYRVFPNPDFDDRARARWNADKFYTDPNYYNDPKLVRPYRIGVTCASCHVAPHPLHPPDDPETPKWEDLASIIGNQYLSEGRAFSPGLKPGDFLYEMTEVQPRGTSDTSRIATDNNNNPNSINAIFNLGARLAVAKEETMAGGTLDLPDEATTMKVPHVLKDGADSVGVRGATIRVYVNIGMFGQYWLTRHNALVGLIPQKPFEVAYAQKHSVYWMATQDRVDNIARFFMRIGPMHLEDAPGGRSYITTDAAVMTRGRIAFAEHCASCHSSKQPQGAAQDEKAWFRQEVVKADFRDDNFLSNDARIPISKVKTNACRALGTNARRGHIWDNFSSETYKTLESVGDIEVYNPYSDANETYSVPGGGRGYYRVPSLVSMWATAPYLNNNALGRYTGDPSVAGRMEAFNDGVDKLLWPEKRLGKDSIWRTKQESWIQIPQANLPRFLHPLCDDGFLKLGPIPAGTPMNLLANVDPEADPKDLLALGFHLKKVLLRIKAEHLDATAAKDLMKNELAARLLEVSKCPDLIEDRGHYFGTDLPDPDKRALIEFLKTL